MTAPQLQRGVDPEVMKKLGVVASDMHQILIAHRMDASMSVNAFCLALATQIKYGEIVGLSDVADRETILDNLLKVVAKNLELMDEMT